MSCHAKANADQRTDCIADAQLSNARGATCCARSKGTIRHRQMHTMTKASQQPNRRSSRRTVEGRERPETDDQLLNGPTHVRAGGRRQEPPRVGCHIWRLPTLNVSSDVGSCRVVKAGREQIQGGYARGPQGRHTCQRQGVNFDGIRTFMCPEEAKLAMVLLQVCVKRCTVPRISIVEVVFLSCSGAQESLDGCCAVQSALCTARTG